MKSAGELGTDDSGVQGCPVVTLHSVGVGGASSSALNPKTLHFLRGHIRGIAGTCLPNSLRRARKP